MFKTITPIDNTVLLERNYDSSRIDLTINNSIKAQKDWSALSIKERVNSLQNFVKDFYLGIKLLTKNYQDKLDDLYLRLQEN